MNASGWVHDLRRMTFLLQLDRRQRLVPTSNNSLLFCRNDWGPDFGRGALYLCDQCNIIPESTTFRVGDTYDKDGPEKYDSGDQVTNMMMSGASKGDTFLVTEYEVFKVCWDKI